MNQKFLYIFSILILHPLAVFCQQDIPLLRQGTHSIIEDINAPKVGQGKIYIMQDETIGSHLAQYRQRTDTSNVIRLSDTKINGFKVQVFSGNNQNKSKREAEQKRSQVIEIFPEHQAQITFEQPNWRLRVGNFVTREEAEELLVRMKEAFPAFGKEMYVVRDVIRRPLD